MTDEVSLSTNTFTGTYLRTQAVFNQLEMFMQYAGLGRRARKRLLAAVDGQWLEEVAVYLVDEHGERFAEAAVLVDWDLHLRLSAVSPDLTKDLPGWEDGAAQEIRVIGRRIGQRAKQLRKETHYWVRFRPEIRTRPGLHKELCSKVGVEFNGTGPPPWRAAPQEESLEVLDLPEVHVSIREAPERGV